MDCEVVRMHCTEKIRSEEGSIYFAQQKWRYTGGIK